MERRKIKDKMTITGTQWIGIGWLIFLVIYLAIFIPIVAKQ